MCVCACVRVWCGGEGGREGLWERGGGEGTDYTRVEALLPQVGEESRRGREERERDRESGGRRERSSVPRPA